jgi:uncharacterized protein (DUF2141 family)
MTSIPFHTRLELTVVVLLFVAICASPLHAQSTTPSTGTITVHVEGLDSDEGAVRIALNDDQNYGMDTNARAGSVSIQDRRAYWTVDDIPYGTYAVRVHHDANGNGKMDANVLGIPQEAFGFSNNANGTLGPLAFEEAAFTLNTDSLSVTIRTE